MDEAEAKEKGLLVEIDEDILEAFVNDVQKQAHELPAAAREALSVVYSPLHGAGYEPVTRVLSRQGFKNVTVVKEQTVEDGNKNAAIELLGEAKYQMFDALIELGNVSFLAIGRPESAGCYCKVNAYLKEIISMIADHFDYVVIDGEAGIEQVNRRVMEKVTHLLLVSDGSRKGLQVVQTIHQVASELVMFDKAGLIVNRMPDMSLLDRLDYGDLKLLACIPDDRDMVLNDLNGESVFCLPESSGIYQGCKQALVELGIL